MVCPMGVRRGSGWGIPGPQQVRLLCGAHTGAGQISNQIQSGKWCGRDVSEKTGVRRRVDSPSEPERCHRNRVPRDRDSGKMGTATSLNRVGCGKQHLKSPLHAMSVVRSPQQQKIVADSPVRKMATVGFSFFFNGL
jgi:hypothetical protein